MKLFNLSFETLMIRYYLMMAAVIVGGFTGMWWLAFLAFPIFMSCLLGMDFSFSRKQQTSSPLTVRRHDPAGKDVDVRSAA